MSALRLAIAFATPALHKTGRGPLKWPWPLGVDHTATPPQHRGPGGPFLNAAASSESARALAVGIGKWAPLVELAHWPDARTVTRTQARTSRTFEQ